MSDAANPLDAFLPITRAWFEQTLGQPTPPQHVIADFVPQLQGVRYALAVKPMPPGRSRMANRSAAVAPNEFVQVQFAAAEADHSGSEPRPMLLFHREHPQPEAGNLERLVVIGRPAATLEPRVSRQRSGPASCAPRDRLAGACTP